MKRTFIIKIVLFVSLFVLINSLLVYFYGKMMSSSQVYKVDVAFTNKDKTGIDILVLGDSHPGHTIWPVYFDKGKTLIKWTSAGESYVQNYYKLKHFLSRYSTKIVVMPVDLHSFGIGRVQNLRNDYFWVKYVDYLELAAITGNYKHFLSKYIKGAWFPYVGESQTIFEWCIKKLKTYANRKRRAANRNFDWNGFPRLAGFLAMPVAAAPAGGKKKAVKVAAVKKSHDYSLLTPEQRMAKAKIRAGHHFRKGIAFSGTLSKYLVKTMRLCKNHGIKVLLVKFPVAAEYYREVAKVTSIDGFYKKVHAIVKGFDNVSILDFQGDFFETPQFMRDVDHVNSVGAKIISGKLNEFIGKLE